MKNDQKKKITLPDNFPEEMADQIGKLLIQIGVSLIAISKESREQFTEVEIKGGGYLIPNTPGSDEIAKDIKKKHEKRT